MWSQVLRFCITGVANTLIDLGVFTILVRDLMVMPVPANVVSCATAITFSFIVNNWWTFDAGRRAGIRGRFLRFAAVNLSSMLLSTILIGALVSFIDPVPAKILSIPVTFLWNFLLCRRFVFLARPAAPSEQD